MKIINSDINHKNRYRLSEVVPLAGEWKKSIDI